jgi:hypothetical protein
MKDSVRGTRGQLVGGMVEGQVDELGAGCGTVDKLES